MLTIRILVDFWKAFVKMCHILARPFNFTFRYILSSNNPNYSEDLYQIHPSELQIKETTDSKKYLDLFLELDQEGKFV